MSLSKKTTRRHNKPQPAVSPMALRNMQNQLTTLVEIALTTDNGYYDTPPERSALLAFSRQFHCLLETTQRRNAEKAKRFIKAKRINTDSRPANWSTSTGSVRWQMEFR